MSFSNTEWPPAEERYLRECLADLYRIIRDNALEGALKAQGVEDRQPVRDLIIQGAQRSAEWYAILKCWVPEGDLPQHPQDVTYAVPLIADEVRSLAALHGVAAVRAEQDGDQNQAQRLRGRSAQLVELLSGMTT